MKTTKHIQDPRLLVISANRWPTAGQIASGLAVAGFQVAALCPVDSPVYRLRKLRAHFPYRFWSSSASIRSAIAAWSPDVLICTDDLAAHALQCLYSDASQNLSDQNMALLNTLKLSFGDCRNLAVTRSKNAILSLAATLGIACPQATVLANYREYSANESGFVFPLMVKADDAWGGLGVQFVHDRHALRAAMAELSLPYHWPGRFKRALQQLLPRQPFHWLFGWRPNVSIQQHVIGHPCTSAVVCWNGKILAGITVDVLATAYEFGPATAVKIAHRSDVTAAAKKLVGKLGLSGFLGFDFVVDPNDNAWFLEMNARATPICHICLENEDLAGALFSQITGLRPRGIYCNVQQDAFTLFPYETPRTRRTMPNAPRERDAPPDEPDYVAACRAHEEANMRDWFWYSEYHDSSPE